MLVAVVLVVAAVAVVVLVVKFSPGGRCGRGGCGGRIGGGSRCRRGRGRGGKIADAIICTRQLLQRLWTFSLFV